MRTIFASVFAGAMFMLTGSAALATDPKATRFYEDALGRYEKKDLAGAILQLKNALKSDSEMLAAHLLLGRALLESGDAVAAEVEFDSALRLGVSRAEVLVPLGRAYLRQGKYAMLLERITPEGLPITGQTDVLVLRASAQTESGNLKEALRILDQARSLDPGSLSVRLAQITVLIRAGELVRAGEIADEALKSSPQDPIAWNAKGSILHLKGDLSGALSAYGKAADLDKKYLDPRVTRAGLFIDLGRFDEAAREVNEILGQEPREPRGNYLKSVIAANRGDTKAMKDALAKVVELLDPVDPSVLALNRQMLFLACLAHYELGNGEKAQEKLSTYLKHYPGEPGPTKLLASVLLDRGDRARALSLLEPLLDSTPNDPRVLSLLATGYMQDKNFRRASELLDQALRSSGGAGDIRTSLGLSLIGSGKAEMGLEQLQQAFAKDPKQIRAGIALTLLYLRTGQAKRALAVIDTVVKNDPANLAALNLLGTAEVAAGDRSGGRKTFEQVLARDSGDLRAILNLARLDTLEKQYDAARRRLSELVKNDIKNVDAMIELAAVEERSGHAKDAIRWLEKARAEPAGILRAGLALGDLHMRAGSFDLAQNVAKESLARIPENLPLLALLTHAQLAKGDRKGAQETLKDMTRFANYDPMAQYEIARLQVAAGNDSGAAYSLEKALSSRADLLPALVLFAEIDIRRRDFAKAEQRIKALAAQHSASGLPLRLQGDLAMARGQFAAAINNYSNALKKQNNAEIALRLFGAHLASGELAKGVAGLEKWNKEHPGDLLVLRTIGDGYLRLGRLSEARGAYSMLLKARPDDPYVLNNLAQIAFKLKDPGAIEIAERAYGLRSTDPLVIDTLGWILVSQGQIERGVGLLRDARLRSPGNPEIRYHLAVGLQKNNRSAEAREELNEALKLGVDFDGVDEARKLQKQWAH